MPQSISVIPLVPGGSGKNSEASSRHPSSELRSLQDSSSVILQRHLTDDSVTQTNTEDLMEEECSFEVMDSGSVMIACTPNKSISVPDVPLYIARDDSNIESDCVEQSNKTSSEANCYETSVEFINQNFKNMLYIHINGHSVNENLDNFRSIMPEVSDTGRDRTKSDSTEVRKALLDTGRARFNNKPVKRTMSTLSVGVVRLADEAQIDEYEDNACDIEGKARLAIVGADDCTVLTTSVLSLPEPCLERFASPSASTFKTKSSTDASDIDVKKREALKDEEDTAADSGNTRCPDCWFFRLFQCLPCSRGSGTQTESLQSWLILVSVLWYNAISAINITGFSVIYIEICDQFNASKAAVGWLPGIKHFVACVVGIFVSHPINQYGCRLSASLGSLIVSLGIAASSLSPNLISMYLLYGVLAGFGQSMTGLAQSVIIQQRFSANRGFATGISTLGFTFGNFAGAPLTSWLLRRYGLRGCLAMLAAIMAHRIPLGLLFYTPNCLIQSKKMNCDHSRSEPAACSSVPTSDTPSDAPANDVNADVVTSELPARGKIDKLRNYLRNSLDFSLFRDVRFTLFCVAGFLHKFYLHAFINHMVSYCKHVGLTTENAVWSLSVIGISAFVFRFIVTLISNSQHVRRLLLFACGLFFGFLSFVLILIIPGTAGPALSAATFGLQTGMTNTILTVVLVDLLSVSNITRCLALFNLTVAFGFLTGSSFVGWLYDMQDSYTAAYAILSAMGLVAACLVFVVYLIDRRRHSSRKQQQRQQQQLQLQLQHNTSPHS